jgi:hypothetical protein
MVAKEFGIGFVHLLEVLPVVEEHGDLDDATKITARRCQDRAEVPQRLRRLRADAALNDAIGLWVKACLAGTKDEVADAHGLRVRSHRLRRVG